MDGGGKEAEQMGLLARISNNIQKQHSSLREELQSGSAAGSMTSIDSTATLGSSINDLPGTNSAVSMELRTAAGITKAMYSITTIF